MDMGYWLTAGAWGTLGFFAGVILMMTLFIREEQ